jgi:glycyl-tRNA synthetase beta chain
MSYQRPDGATVQFVRPAHGLIALHGADIVPVSLLGLPAATPQGHRFLSGHHRDPARRRVRRLLESRGRVIAGYGDRRERIRAALLKSRRRPGADAGIAAGRSDRAGRMAGGLRATSRNSWPCRRNA